MSSELSSLLQLMRGHRRAFAAATLALVASIALGHLVPLLVGAALDVITGAPVRGPLAPLVRSPWIAGLAIVVVTAGSGAFAWLRGRLSARASEGLCRELRDRLHDHVQRLPMSWLDRADTGDLVQRCTSDVETVRLFLSTQVVEIGRTVLLIALALPLMLMLDVRMTLAALVLFPPIFAFGMVFFARVKRRFLEADEAEGAMTSVLQENLAGARVVRAFAAEPREIARFGAQAARFRDLQLRVVALMATYWAASDLICGAQLALVLFVGAARVAAGELSVGALYAFTGWAALLIWPVRQMGRTLTDTGKAIVSLRRIREILEVEQETDAPEPPRAARAFEGRLQLRGVSFAHAGGRAILEDVTLDVEPGQVVALVGPPGCGKSTLVSLLLRLHEPTAGDILLDGTPLSSLPRREVRRLIASALQEPFLYSRTIEQNVRVGRAGASRDDVEAAAHAACVHDAVTSFPDGYDTVVGERGVTLSGGQRQRLALARTLLSDAPVLVLDDALSAVDTATEARIREALARRRGRRTCLVIAHRLTTAREADVVVVLDQGRIAQRGSHAELLLQDGPYRRSWQRQDDALARVHAVVSEGGAA